MCRKINIRLVTMRWITLICFGVLTGVTAQNKPSFTITAPNILCSNEVQSHHQAYFTIRLVPEDGQHLNYNITVNYEYAIPQRTQHHSLHLWDTLRKLEAQLSVQRTLINSENKIDIATTTLTPGVIYIFDIVAEDENGVVSDKQQFVLEYKDGKLYRMCKDEAELLNETVQSLTEDLNDRSWIRLKGPKLVYANLPVILTAKVNFIGLANEYYVRVKWTLNDSLASNKKILSSKGHTLTIQPFTLRAGTHYSIIADLIDAASSRAIARSSLNIFVRYHELKAYMIPTDISAGIDRNLNFEIKLFDRNVNKPKFTVEWRCSSTPSGALCENFNPNQFSKKITVSFSEPGNYQIQAIVTNQDNLTITKTGNVLIDRNIIPRLSIHEFPNQPVDITKWIKANANLEFVVAGCRANWSLLQEQGYGFMDLGTVVGGIGEIIVHDFESFLTDIADFSNVTVSKHVRLRVPPSYTYPDWNGMLPDQKFKFRLTLDCPPAIDSSNQVSSSSANRSISYLDIEMDTNSPPSQSSLTIAPETGFALVTNFMFMSTLAQDQDKPVIYSYGITFNETTLVLGRGNGMLNFAHILPFNDQIQIFSEACDTYGACSKVFGPSVATQLPSNITFDFIRDDLDFLESGLDRMEYNTSLNRMIIFGVTLRQVPDYRLFQEFKTNVVQLLRAENNKVLEFRKNEVIHFTDEEVFDYVRGVKLVMEQLDIRDKEIIFSSVDLIETILVKIGSENQARDIKRKRRQAFSFLTQTDVESSLNRTYNDQVVLDSLKLSIDLLNSQNSSDSSIFEIARNILKIMCFFSVGEQANNNTVTLRTFKHGHDYGNFSTTDFATSHQDGAWTASARFGGFYELDENDNDYCVSSFVDAKEEFPIYQWMLFKRNRKVNKTTFEDVDVTHPNSNHVTVQINLNGTYKSDQLECKMRINSTWDSKLCVTNTSDPNKLICICEKNEAVSFDVVKNVSSSTSDKIVVPNTEPNATFTSIPTTATSTLATTTMNTSQATSRSTPTTIQTTSTTPSTTSLSTTTTVPATPVPSTASSTTSMAATPIPQPNPTGAPSTTKPGPADKNPDDKVTVTEEQDSPTFASAVAYTALAVLVIGVILGGVFVYIYRSNNLRNNSFTLDLQSIAAEARSQMPGVRYARFQDENIMRGDVYSVG